VVVLIAAKPSAANRPWEKLPSRRGNSSQSSNRGLGRVFTKPGNNPDYLKTQKLARKTAMKVKSKVKAGAFESWNRCETIRR
jgi:hypothetical protein